MLPIKMATMLQIRLRILSRFNGANIMVSLFAAGGRVAMQK